MRTTLKSQLGSKSVASLFLALALVITGPAVTLSRGTGDEVGPVTTSVYEGLRSLYTDDPQMLGIVTQLHDWGILADNGDVQTKNEIVVAGVGYTLEEIDELIAGGADPTTEARVGDTVLTLGDIDIMLQIEAEADLIRQVQESNDVTMTEEHYAALMSLTSQLQSSGFQLLAAPNSDPPIKADIQLRAAFYDYQACESASGRVCTLYRLRVWLTGSTDSASAYPVTVAWDLLPGSGSESIHWDYLDKDKDAADRVITLQTDDPGSYNPSYPPTALIEYKVYRSSDETDFDFEDPLYRWTGDRVFFVRFHDATNAVFQENGRDTYTYQQTIHSSRTYSTSLSNSVTKVPIQNWDTGSSIVQFAMDALLGGPGPNNRDIHDITANDPSNDPGYVPEPGEIILPGDIPRAIFDYDIQITGMGWVDQFGNANNGLDGWTAQVSYPQLYQQVDTDDTQPDPVGEYRAGGSLLSPNQYQNNINSLVFSRYAWTRLDYNLNQVSVSYDTAAQRYRYPGYLRYPVFEPNGFVLSSAYQTTMADLSATVTLHDEVAPRVLDVTVPPGTYTPGSQIPITVTFSEPVFVAQTRLEVNASTTTEGTPIPGTILTPLERNLFSGYQLGFPHALSTLISFGTFSNQATFLYEVQTVDDIKLQVNSVNGGERSVDLFDHLFVVDRNDDLGWTFTSPEVNIVTARMSDALVNAKLDKDASGNVYAPADTSAQLRIELDQSFEQAFVSDWSLDASSRRVSQSLYIGCDGANYPLVYEQDGLGVYSLVGDIALPTVSAEATLTYPVNVYYSPDGWTDLLEPGGGKALPAFSTTLTRQSQPYVSSSQLAIQIPTQWGPAFGPYVIYPSTSDVQLTYTYSGGNQPTPSFTWSSSDTDVAAIVADAGSPTGGVVTVVGTGTVRFRLTSNDQAADKAAWVETPDIKIWQSTDPYLTIPAALAGLPIYQGDDASVNWSTNLFDFNLSATPQRSTTFEIDLYDGNHQGGDLAGLTPAFSDTLTIAPADPRSTTYQIEASHLTSLSVGGVASYTVRVSAAHPNQPGVTLSALAYIVVNSPPAKATLTRPSSLYVLDDAGAVSIDWVLERVDVANGAEAEFSILKGDLSLPGATRTLSGMTQTGPQEFTGSHTLTPAAVASNQLKDIYQVYLKAKNQLDGTWSYDSFVLYVYNHTALKILADGQARSSLTMSNQDWAAGTVFAGMSAEDIADLRQTLYLHNLLSINYDAYDWNPWHDSFAWETSNADVATVNYKQYVLYSPVEDYPIDGFLPSTQFLLAGLADGTTTIKATHAATGMETTLDVSVRRLVNKFYLFQFNPMITTEMYYTDGKGVSKQVTSGSDGALALYEPDGIASDVSLLAKDGSGYLWLGTIVNSTLKSGERDITLQQWYPLNTIRLHQATNAEIYLKNETGKPYTGQVTVHGGVYKNGVYLGDLRALVNTSDLGELSHPETGVTVQADSTGRLSINFFPEDLGEIYYSDRLEFIFELQFGADAYRPEMVYVNANLNYADRLRLGETTLQLTPAITKSPFLAVQRADYHLPDHRTSSLLGYTGLVGPGSSYPQVDVVSTMMLWGVPLTGDLNYTTYVKDNFDVQPGVQTQQSSVIVYPFSTIAIVEHQLTLENTAQQRTLWWGADDHKARKLTLFLLSPDDRLLKQQDMDWRLADMTYLEQVDAANNVALLLDTLNISAQITNALPDSLEFVGGLAESGVRKLATMDASTGFFKMLVGPTQSPAEFHAYIWAGMNGPAFEDNGTGVYMEGSAFDYKANFIPGMGDVITGTKQGSPLATVGNAKDRLFEDGGYSVYDQRTSQIAPKFHLNGYFEARLVFNFDTGKWECFVLNGGFSAGFGLEVNFNFNAQVGPVPVTAYLRAGAYAGVTFTAATRYSQMAGLEWVDDKKMANDYLTELRLTGYIRAFGGIGRDMTIVAFKIGLFGQLDVDFVTRFLNRDYLNDSNLRRTNGQYLNLKGSVGVEIKIKFAFFEITETLFSFGLGNVWNFNEWTDINQYWEQANKIQAQAAFSPFSGASAPFSVLASSGVTLESRDYLDEYDRAWYAPLASRTRSLDVPNGLAALQDNAYPYSNPLLSRDGQLLVYASDGGSADLADTQVMWSREQSGGYPQGTPIEATSTDSFGISGLQFDGDLDHAAAVWVRQGTDLEKGAGDSVTAGEQMLLLNSSEIMVALWDGATWTTGPLTNSSSPNLAPVVAVDGERVLVAWRNVSSSDPGDPLGFDTDSVLYRVYDGTAWSGIHTLYNGSAGTIYGLSGAMLPAGGNLAVSYAVDTSSGPEQNLDVVYAVIDATSLETIRNTQVTDSEATDENPQLIAVNFGAGVDDYRFVLGWHSQGEYSDIQLASFDEAGVLDPGFINSFAPLATDGKVSFSSNFGFAKMADNVNSIANLTLLWPEPAGMYAEDVAGEPVSVDSDHLKAITFVEWESGYVPSAPMTVADMGERPLEPVPTTVDSFDAYVVGDHQVRAVVQASEYDSGARVFDGRNGGELTSPLTGAAAQYNVYVPNDETKLFTASETFSGDAQVVSIYTDFDLVFPKSKLPVQFTIRNTGAQPITAISASDGLQTKSLLTSGQTVLPNETRDLGFNHSIADVIEDFDYTLTFTYADGTTQQVTGPVVLEVFDVGISKAEVIREENGLREVEVTLYNQSSLPLAGSGTTVKLGVYEDQSHTTPTTYLNNGADPVFTVSDQESLRLIDAGAYTMRFVFNVRNAINGTRYTTDEEVPAGGLWVYLNTWLEDAAGEAMPEFYAANNSTAVGFESLLSRAGVGLSVQASYSNSRVEAWVTNNHLNYTAAIGYLVVNLYNAADEVVATQVRPMDSSMPGEATNLRTFDFPYSPDYVRAKAFISEGEWPSDDNADLEVLSVSGLPVSVDDFESTDTVTYENYVGDLVVTALPRVQGVTVTINGESAPNLTATVPVPAGAVTDIVIVVTALDGVTTKTYTLRIDNSTSDVELSQTGTHTFPWKAEGYSAAEALTVTVTNTGTATSQNLAAWLSLGSEAYFTLDTTGMATTLSGAGSTTFTVTPKTGLAIGEYTATVVVTGDANISKSFDVEFSVTDGLVYDLEVTPGVLADHFYLDAVLPEMSTTVTNIGTGAVSGLNLTLSGADAGKFVIDTTGTATSLAPGAETNFLIRPDTSVIWSPGTYTATVTLTADPKVSKSFNIDFTVTDAPTSDSYQLQVVPYDGSTDFPDMQQGYTLFETIDYKYIAVTNIGASALTDLSFAKSGANPESFTIDDSQFSSIPGFGPTYLRVIPVAGLTPGTYTMTLTLTGTAPYDGTQFSESVDLSFTVVSGDGPKGAIMVGEPGGPQSIWDGLVTPVGYTWFHQGTQQVTIQSQEPFSRGVDIEYLLSDVELTQAELEASADWVALGGAYSDGFSLDPPYKTIVYAKLTFQDTGKVSYFNTSGLVIFTDPQAMASALFTRVSPDDLTVGLSMRGNTVDQITRDQVALVEGVDYTFGVDTITFKNAYLQSLPDGDQAFTVTYHPLGETGTPEPDSQTPGSTALTISVDRSAQSPLEIVDLASGHTYGDAPFALTTSGGSGTGAVTFTAPPDNGVVSISAAGEVTILGAGSVTLTAIKAGDATYGQTAATLVVSVGKLAITVTADNQSKYEGAPDPVLTYKVTPGLVGADVLVGSLKHAGTTPGSYDIVEDVPFAHPFYEITFAKGAMTINAVGGQPQDPLVIADPAIGHTYGDAPFSLTTTGGSGSGAVSYLAPPGNGVLTVGADGQVSITGAGAVTVTATKAGDSAYAPITATLVVAVAKKPITVTADDQAKFVGAPDPVLTYTITPGLVGADVLTGSLKHDGVAAGSYDIVEDVVFVHANYDITFVKGTMTISAPPSTPEVVDLINALPDPVVSRADADKVVAATKAFEGLAAIEQDQVPQPVRDRLAAAQQQAGEVNRTDTANGVTISGDLAWSIRLVVTPISATDPRHAGFLAELTGRQLLALYDIKLINTLTGQDYQLPPGETVSVELTNVDLSGSQDVRVAHQNPDGTLTTLAATTINNTIRFQASQFSLYGVTAAQPWVATGGTLAPPTPNPAVALIGVILLACSLTLSFTISKRKHVETWGNMGTVPMFLLINREISAKL